MGTKNLNKNVDKSISLQKLYFAFENNLNFEMFSYSHIFKFYFSFFNIININIDWSRRTDHAGFDFSMTILFIDINYNYYDIRHWNYDEEEFENYEHNG